MTLYEKYVKGMTFSQEEFNNFIDNHFSDFKDLLDRLFLEGDYIFEITGGDSVDEEILINIEDALCDYYNINPLTWIDYDEKIFHISDELEGWVYKDITERGWRIEKRESFY